VSVESVTEVVLINVKHSISLSKVPESKYATEEVLPM